MSLPTTALPFGDISVHYQAYTPDNISFTCLDIAPVGYQNPVWRQVLIAVPVAFAVFAAIVTIFSIYVTSTDAEQDILISASNYGIEPSALRLKTPGLFDIVFYAQFIVVTGQLNIKYPLFYPLFTSNFAWSNLLFVPDFINDIVNTIFPAQLTTDSSGWYQSEPGLSLNKRQMGFGAAANDTNPVVVASTGMANFANAVGLDVRALFITSLIFYLIILACIIFLCIIACMVLEFTNVNSSYQKLQRSRPFDLTIGACLRTLTLFYLPLITMSFYQLMLPAPWYLLLPAALMLVFPLFGLFAWIAFLLLRIRPPSVIFSDMTLLLRYGTLYSAFTDDTFTFFILVVVYKALVGAMVGLFQASGLAQVIVIIILETVFLLAHWFKVPYADRSINNFYISFGAVRIIISILNILFVDEANLLDWDKQYIAYAQIFLHCVAFLVLFSVSLKNLILIVTGMSSQEPHENSRLSAGLGLRWMRRRPQRPRFSHVPSRSISGPIDVPENEMITTSSKSNKFGWRRSTGDASVGLPLQHLNNGLRSATVPDMLNNGSGSTLGPQTPPPQPPKHGIPLTDDQYGPQNYHRLSAFGPSIYTVDSLDSPTPTPQRLRASSNSNTWMIPGHQRQSSTSTAGVATSQADSNTSNSNNPSESRQTPSNSTMSNPSDNNPVSPTESSFYRPSRRSLRKRSGDYGGFGGSKGNANEGPDPQATPRPGNRNSNAPQTTVSPAPAHPSMNDIELYRILGPEGMAAIASTQSPSSGKNMAKTPSSGGLFPMSTSASGPARQFNDTSVSTGSISGNEPQIKPNWSRQSQSTDTHPSNQAEAGFYEITNDSDYDEA
ncbi:hypothetical protein K450DRAFT_227884 [Umbelopsis ramanniana AG]|uniref:TRP C-terminal domain-containing protein n=1 Tax=Umbelopsis ramanniana AG TaxID=1314678 RepID=A0AAD5EE37_UMBRA|nr:uncharacterized protein K450DRAFT_227884 [Umbelopsis ramanniana AG]KAI8582201.1 hypothetical protein K450DRAFT_227884 [Umbelopsis ramanniana AG]